MDKWIWTQAEAISAIAPEQTTFSDSKEGVSLQGGVLLAYTLVGSFDEDLWDRWATEMNGSCRDKMRGCAMRCCSPDDVTQVQPSLDVVYPKPSAQDSEIFGNRCNSFLGQGPCVHRTAAEWPMWLRFRNADLLFPCIVDYRTVPQAANGVPCAWSGNHQQHFAALRALQAFRFTLTASEKYRVLGS